MSSPSRLQRGRLRIQAHLAKPRPFLLSAQRDEARVPSFAQWCLEHRGTTVEIGVSSWLLHELTCEPGLPLDGDEDLQAYAAQQFTHYFGGPAQQWPLAMWRVGDRCGASALCGVDWGGLQACAREHQVVIKSARPCWALVLAQLARDEPVWFAAPQAAMAWVEGSATSAMLCWLQLREGQLQAVWQRRLAAPTVQALDAAIAELTVDGERVITRGHGLAGMTHDLQYGTVGRASVPQPDFLARRSKRSPLAWPLLVTAALVLAGAGQNLLQSRQALDASQTELAALEDRWRKLRPLHITPTEPALKAEALPMLAEVQGLLRQSWEPVLANVEQAGVGQVSWLGLSYNASRNELRLDGSAPSKPVALLVANRLGAAPGWRDVVLNRFEAGAGGAGQRFELSARLRSDQLQASLPSIAENAGP